MRKKGLKGLMSLCLSVCMICLPVSAQAQELNSEVIQDGETNIPIESLDVNATALDISDAYAEMPQMEESSEDYTSNTMDKTYEGVEVNITNLPDNATTYAEQEDQENTDPNNAYLVENENIVQGVLTQESEMRWYGFILDQNSKVSIMLQTASEVDADLYLFKLDQETYELNLIGGSSKSGLGVYEYYNELLDTGIYYFAVSAYEGSGQYAFAFYATQGIGYEINDTLSSAAEISVNGTITGVIDTPYDVDYYTFTLSSPVIMSMTKNVGNYDFGIMNTDDSAKIYKISQKEELYQFDAGTYYFVVRSTDGTYNANSTYRIELNKIANIADNTSSFYYMVNEKAKIVFQSDPYGSNMYVNGNPIDISYSYNVDASNSAGSQRYNISMSTPSDLSAKIYQDQFMFEDYDTTVYYGMTMPDTVNYRGGSKGVGPTGNVLELSVYSANKFYNIHCICSGAYAANNLYKDLNFVTVFINPNTGKLVDIQHINYFYEYATGSNSMSFTRPYSSYTKYYYPYYNGEEPFTW